MKLFTAGLGGTVGDSLVTAKQYQTCGTVYYVSSLVGSDAASGLNRTSPHATIAHAITTAADFDDIVLLAGHAETTVATITVNKRVRILGEGTFGTASMPTFTRNHGGRLFDVTVTRAQIRGVRFAAGTFSSASHTVALGATDCHVRGCYFSQGANDTAAAVGLVAGSDRALIEATTILSAATSLTAAPGNAILSAAALADIRLIDLVIDGGPFGWLQTYAVDFGSGGAVTNLQAENISLLNDSDMSIIGTPAANGAYVSLGTCSGSARVVHA